MNIKTIGNNPSNIASNIGTKKEFAFSQPQGATIQANASSSIVTISSSAKEATQAISEPTFNEVAKAARDKLNDLKEQGAKKAGISATSVNLNHLDYSSFSEQDLAAMRLDPNNNFSKDEKIHAGAVLNERLRVSLETYRGATELGDRRGHTITIDALYKQMSPEVRSAMGWTPTMMAQNDYLMALDEGKFGKFPISAVLENLQNTQAQGGLTFKLALWNEKE